MVTLGGLKLGGNQRVFINGGSGGTGIGAMQVAKAFGAFVVSTCSPASSALVRSLGADVLIDYRSVNLPAHLTENYSGSNQFDIIVDCVGLNEVFLASPAFLKPDGFYANVGGAQDMYTLCQSLGFLWIVLVNTYFPSILGGTPRRHSFIMMSPEEGAATFKDSEYLVATGQVKMVIDSQFPMEDVLKGYERTMSGRAKGKIVINIA